jgi:hydroxymethylbilane synthase
MQKSIRIGTRSSELAMWQAKLVQTELEKNNYNVEIIKIDSEGDANLIQPIYKLGFSGVFTKSLDSALLNDKIDIAVHSLKDVPTELPKHLLQIAVLERATSKDILKFKGKNIDFSDEINIGTGSIRRKAQWLNKYPHHKIEGLRGNVNTRLSKIESNQHWTGAIFAKAGLERINLLSDNYIDLDWMIPAPAQGAIGIVAHEKFESTELKSILNDINSELTTTIERDFMNEIQAGCSSPVAALAEIKLDTVYFRGLIISLDGKEKAEINESINIKDSLNFGRVCAKQMIAKHGDLVKKIKLDLSEL